MSPLWWFVHSSKFTELPLILSCMVSPSSLFYFGLLYKTFLFTIDVSSSIPAKWWFVYYKYSSSSFLCSLIVSVIKLKFLYFALWSYWLRLPKTTFLPYQMVPSANRRCQGQSARMEEEKNVFCWLPVCSLFPWISSSPMQECLLSHGSSWIQLQQNKPHFIPSEIPAQPVGTPPQKAGSQTHRPFL